MTRTRPPERVDSVRNPIFRIVMVIHASHWFLFSLRLSNCDVSSVVSYQRDISSFELIIGKKNALALILNQTINLFSFPNDLCVGGSKNGTCYTSSECTTKGGTSDGTCASGYGVCCTCKNLQRPHIVFHKNCDANNAIRICRRSAVTGILVRINHSVWVKPREGSHFSCFCARIP